MTARWQILLCAATLCVAASIHVTSALASPTEIVVQPGDALSVIAKRHAVALADLRSWNALETDRIEAGRTLRIAGPSGAQTSTAHKASYEIRPGDTLSGIAVREGCSVADLVEWNPGLDPDRIYAGQTLTVSEAAQLEEHKIAEGETLTSIARLHHVSVEELTGWNPGLSPNRIRAGKTLKVSSRRPKSLSESIGLPYAGKLVNAARLTHHPAMVIRDLERAYATDETVRALHDGLSGLQTKHPKSPRIEVHDLSLVHGGQMADHASHQSGRDVDLAILARRCPQGVCGFRRHAAADVDWERQWTLLYHWLRREQVEAILIDYNLQAGLYREAKRRGASPDELNRWFQYPRGRDHPGGTIRHQANHADHVHVRFACHRSDPLCSPVRVIAEEARLARAATSSLR